MNDEHEDMAAKMQDRVAKLLRKAERASTEAEADAFNAKAEEILLKWNIDRAKLETEEGRREEIVQERMTFSGAAGSTRRDYIEVCHFVVQGLGGLRSFRTKSNTSYKLEDLLVVGHKSDVEAAIWLASSILLQAQTSTLRWWKSMGLTSKEVTAGQRAKYKSSFMIGFALKVKERLTALRERVTQEAGSGTDLVLYDRMSAVDEWVDNLHGKLRKGRARGVNGAAYQQGGVAGAAADLGQDRVQNSNRQALKA